MSKQCNSKSNKASNPDYICNPQSGQWVKISGAVGKKLVAMGSKALATAPLPVQVKSADQQLANACLGKSKGKGGMNVGEMYDLAKARGYGGPKTRGDVTKFLCNPKSPMVPKPAASSPKLAKKASPKPAPLKASGCIQFTASNTTTSKWKKYSTRASPPFPANECPEGMVQKGNDGFDYVVSPPNAKGSKRWVKITGAVTKKASPKPAAKKASPKPAAKKASPKPASIPVVSPLGTCESGNNGKIVFSGGVLLAKEYLDKKTGEPSFDPTGWWISEKFDGYRSVWNGQSFVSRSGKPFIVPDWFSALMPPNVALDGEFWVGRGCFQSCGIFRKKVPDTQEWINSEVTYKVFDLPSSNKPFEARIADLKKVVEERCSCMVQLKLPDGIVTVKCPLEHTEQIKATSAEHVDEMFKDVIEGGGEGLMLRQAGSQYEQKRSGTLRKLKVAFDTECSIVDYKPGTGKYDGMLGSFKCELSSNKGKYFYVSGMNDQTRVDYKTTHPKGTIITVTFNDYSKDGIPRHPRYLRKRTDAGL